MKMKTYESKFYEALCTIIEMDAECDAILLLSKNVSEKLDKYKSQNSEMQARLRTIRKINGNKNEFIESLCELQKQ